MSESAARPWKTNKRLDGNIEIVTGDGAVLATVYGDDDDPCCLPVTAHADLICNSVNAHDALTAQVAELRKALEGVSLTRLADGSLCFCLYGREKTIEHNDACRIARAVLATEK